jgi:hypothetical protein
MLSRVAVVQGVPSTVAQDVFRAIVGRWRPRLRIAGVIEERDGVTEGRTCRAGMLRSIGDGALYPMFEKLPPGAAACDIQDARVTGAAAAVLADNAAGCDLVVLSKFGKLEASGGGLMAAFGAAVAADIPLLTYASPADRAAWAGFTAPPAVVLPAEVGAVDEWLRALAATAVNAARVGDAPRQADRPVRHA